ncbi:NAD(P)-binding domain-containing protein [Flavobacterium sp. D11R37]|uniref:NADPH-dependent F420 reductase n=1 Tax=Flavobacterium coralii TaxID=2838017 RepID=UPI001CA78F53|nr:NAD(P)-binding domain-containing protein [Flavobacterium coralii]MBY8962877.1 NAD(P)-binding domain-containing protein [Flavobacterium coralii]
MNIAVIGTGNVGGALAQKWAGKGHTICLGVRDMGGFKGNAIVAHENIKALSIDEAVQKSDIILLAVPAANTIEAVKALGDTTGKIIIDAMNIIMNKGPEGFTNTSDAILANTQTEDVVKCFNTTGYNNMADTVYDDMQIDMFVCGNSTKGKEAATALRAKKRQHS